MKFNFNFCPAMWRKESAHLLLTILLTLTNMLASKRLNLNSSYRPSKTNIKLHCQTKPYFSVSSL